MKFLKSLGLAFLVAILLVSVREIMEIGNAEYFLSSGKIKFVQNMGWGLASVLVGWMYVYAFKVLKMID